MKVVRIPQTANAYKMAVERFVQPNVVSPSFTGGFVECVGIGGATRLIGELFYALMASWVVIRNCRIWSVITCSVICFKMSIFPFDENETI